MYKVKFGPDAEKDIEKLDKEIAERIIRKIEWIAINAENIIHHQLSFLPEDLKGLCRIHIGDYRVLYWIYFEEQRIQIYRIEHRSEVYKWLRRKK